MVLGVRRLGRVNHQIESVGRWILDRVGIDREVGFVDSLLREVGIPYKDSGRTLRSACKGRVSEKQQPYIGRTITSTMTTKARR